MVEFDIHILTRLIAYTSDSGTLADSIVDEFFLSAPDLLKKIKEALAHKELQAIADHALTLRTMAASLGLIRVSELCGELEYGTLISAAKDIPELTRAFGRAANWLKEWQRNRTNQVA